MMQELVEEVEVGGAVVEEGVIAEKTSLCCIL